MAATTTTRPHQKVAQGPKLRGPGVVYELVGAALSAVLRQHRHGGALRLVIQLAGWYRLGDPNTPKWERINIDGTRSVLELAHELGVPRIVYISSLAIYGDTQGFVPDETYRPRANTVEDPCVLAKINAISPAALAESCGVNTVLTNPALCEVINDYWRNGGKIQFISDCGGKDVLEMIQKSIDRAACACYIQGGVADKLVQDGKFDLIA